ncbi:MAG: hypothetical protein R3C53_21360 [Pirellulaceae bacterium]
MLIHRLDRRLRMLRPKRQAERHSSVAKVDSGQSPQNGLSWLHGPAPELPVVEQLGVQQRWAQEPSHTPNDGRIAHMVKLQWAGIEILERNNLFYHT